MNEFETEVVFPLRSQLRMRRMQRMWLVAQKKNHRSPSA